MFLRHFLWQKSSNQRGSLQWSTIENLCLSKPSFHLFQLLASGKICWMTWSSWKGFVLAWNGERALAYRFGYQQSNAGTQFKDHSGFQRGSVGLGYRSDQASIHLALVSNYRQARIYNPINSDLWTVNALQHQLVIGVNFRV